MSNENLEICENCDYPIAPPGCEGNDGFEWCSCEPLRLYTLDECIENCKEVAGEMGLLDYNESILRHLQKYRDVSNQFEAFVMQLLADKNIKLIKHLAKRKIEDCKYSAYGCYDAGNEAEGDYGDWKDWENILAEFATEILTKVSKQSA